MRTIWKYSLPLTDDVYGFVIPRGGKIVHVAMQGIYVAMWVDVYTPNQTETRLFVIRGTGHEITHTDAAYIGTAMDGPFVWHVFEVTP